MSRIKEYLPIGKDPKYNIYHDLYDRYRMQSRLLNAAANTIDVSMRFFDREGLESEMLSLQGDEDAKIPQVLAKLKELDHQWELYKKRAVREGQPVPEGMTKNIFNEKMKLEAHLSVYLEEVQEIEKSIENYTEQVVQKSNRNVLRDGPVGVSRLRHGVIVEADGMNVSLSDDEIPIPYINEANPKAAPYNGYAVADYFIHVVKVWGRAKQEQMKLNQKRINELVKADKGDEIPKGLKTGTNVPWPKMPNTCKNYLKKEEIKRTKK